MLHISILNTKVTLKFASSFYRNLIIFRRDKSYVIDVPISGDCGACIKILNKALYFVLFTTFLII